MRTIWIRYPVTYASVVHSTWPSPAMWRMHAPTFNKQHKKKKNKKVTLHMLTHGIMRGCGLTSWVVCINDKFRDIRERNVTIRSEIWTTNIRSLGFQDIRKCVTLWRLIVRLYLSLFQNSGFVNISEMRYVNLMWAPFLIGFTKLEVPGWGSHSLIWDTLKQFYGQIKQFREV